MNNTTENIPADAMGKARILRDGVIARGASEWAAERIAQALLAAQIQGLRMAAEIADRLCETASGYDPMAVAIMDAIAKAADELEGEPIMRDSHFKSDFKSAPTKPVKD